MRLDKIFIFLQKKKRILLPRDKMPESQIPSNNMLNGCNAYICKFFTFYFYNFFWEPLIPNKFYRQFPITNYLLNRPQKKTALLFINLIKLNEIQIFFKYSSSFLLSISILYKNMYTYSDIIHNWTRVAKNTNNTALLPPNTNIHIR